MMWERLWDTSETDVSHTQHLLLDWNQAAYTEIPSCYEKDVAVDAEDYTVESHRAAIWCYAHHPADHAFDSTPNIFGNVQL
jgi:hypothetical protein